MEELIHKNIGAIGTVDLLKAIGIKKMDVNILNGTFWASAKETRLQQVKHAFLNAYSKMKLKVRFQTEKGNQI